MRYVFVNPIIWSEEVILVLLVIFGYICISIDVYRDAHVALTVIYNRVPKKVQIALDFLRHTLIGVFFALMVQSGWKVYQIKARKIMAASGLSQGICFYGAGGSFRPVRGLLRDECRQNTGPSSGGR